MKKQLSALVAALAIVSATSCPVMAAEPLALPDDSGIVQPQYTNISYVDVNLDKYGNIEGTVLMSKDYRYVVTVELRKSSGGFVDSWQNENGDVFASYDLESGVKYYAKVTVKVYNSAGRVIETATAKTSTVTGA